MYELGLHFKILPQKGHVGKGKKGRGRKQSKKRCSIALFVAANGSKVWYGNVKSLVALES